MTIARYTETTFFPVIVSWKYLNGYLPMITDMHVNSNTFRLFEKIFYKENDEPRVTFQCYLSNNFIKYPLKW